MVVWQPVRGNRAITGQKANVYTSMLSPLHGVRAIPAGDAFSPRARALFVICRERFRIEPREISVLIFFIDRLSSKR